MMDGKCDHCDKNFNKNDSRMRCAFCDSLFHPECATILTPSLTRTVLESVKKNKWKPYIQVQQVSYNSQKWVRWCF